MYIYIYIYIHKHVINKFVGMPCMDKGTHSSMNKSAIVLEHFKSVIYTQSRKESAT